MMKRTLVLSGITLCAALIGVPALAAESKGMESMKDMPAGAKPAAKMVMGKGVVKSVDVEKGTVTISHDPIKELNWPAMTMGFKVADPALLKKASVGKKVEFALEDRGSPTIVAIN